MGLLVGVVVIILVAVLIRYGKPTPTPLPGGEFWRMYSFWGIMGGMDGMYKPRLSVPARAYIIEGGLCHPYGTKIRFS